MQQRNNILMSPLGNIKKQFVHYVGEEFSCGVGLNEEKQTMIVSSFKHSLMVESRSVDKPRMMKSFLVI